MNNMVSLELLAARSKLQVPAVNISSQRFAERRNVSVRTSDELCETGAGLTEPQMDSLT